MKHHLSHNIKSKKNSMYMYKYRLLILTFFIFVSFLNVDYSVFLEKLPMDWCFSKPSGPSTGTVSV